MRPVDAVVAWRAILAARELRRAHPSIAIDSQDEDPALEERVADAVRPGPMSEALRTARSAPTGRDGDPARARLRLLAPIYLDRVEPRLRSALRDRRDAAFAAWGGDVDATLAAEGDALRRRSIAVAFAAACDGLARLEAELDAARDAAARSVGAGDAHALVASAWTPGGSVIAAEVERGFIAPLDDAVERATGERARRIGAAPGEPIRPEDVPRMSWCPQAPPTGAPSRFAGALRRLGGALGMDPDLHGARLETVERPPAATVLHDALASRAVVIVGSWQGPRGFVEACAAFGRGQRASFLVRAQSAPVAALAEPAFAHAAAALFGRIAITERGLSLAAIPASDDTLRDQLLEETIAARCAWAELAFEVGAARDRAAAWLRAGGRPSAPGAAFRAERADEDPAARVRGLIFGLLLEERLLTRFGRAWFDAPEAGAFLRDLWAAEPGERPESMAAALGLGTMDSSPLLEAFRPRKGRGV